VLFVQKTPAADWHKVQGKLSQVKGLQKKIR